MLKELSKEELKDWATPSWVFKTAAEDFKKCMNSHHYIIDMDGWHKPKFLACRVCLVMTFLI